MKNLYISQIEIKLDNYTNINKNLTLELHNSNTILSKLKTKN